ncbi:MAG TPA: DUF2795 domain-containing protein [Actinomycetales bacterium]|nr:DUF2795 domain-containing protein [Actinomycetales bacterium]
MTQQSGPVSPREDEQLAHETEGLVRSGHPTRVEEFRDPEPPGEDQPTGDEHLMAPDREPGTAPGLTPEDVETRSEIARFLGLSAFPGRRDDLVAAASEHQATDRVLNLLEQLPSDQEFRNVQDVARALGLGTEDHRV